MPPLRIIFFGTAELACASLARLAQSKLLQVIAIVSQPDKPRGRDLKLTPTAVKSEARRLALPVLQPIRARDPQFVQTLAELHPDLIVVAAYGQILPQAILDLPRFGCLNVHTSLLPKYRGAAPIQWAILNGDFETGVTIMKMDAGLDTGDVLTQERTPITAADNSQTVHDRLAHMGAELLLRTIPPYVTGELSSTPQLHDQATHARKITKEDGRLDWTQPASVLWNRIRAFTPWPGAFTFLANTAKQPLLKIWQTEVADVSASVPGQVLTAKGGELVVACGEKALHILELQREGGRRMKTPEFLTGGALREGTCLSAQAS